MHHEIEIKMREGKKILGRKSPPAYIYHPVIIVIVAWDKAMGRGCKLR